MRGYLDDDGVALCGVEECPEIVTAVIDEIVDGHQRLAYEGGHKCKSCCLIVCTEHALVIDDGYLYCTACETDYQARNVVTAGAA